jgi:hypothetical protein
MTVLVWMVAIAAAALWIGMFVVFMTMWSFTRGVRQKMQMAMADTLGDQLCAMLPSARRMGVMVLISVMGIAVAVAAPLVPLVPWAQLAIGGADLLLALAFAQRSRAGMLRGNWLDGLVQSSSQVAEAQQRLKDVPGRVQDRKKPDQDKK